MKRSSGAVFIEDAYLCLGSFDTKVFVGHKEARSSDREYDELSHMYNETQVHALGFVSSVLVHESTAGMGT